MLTGGALLHAAADFTSEELKAAMALFGSTSPSYLIMQSLDACADYLETQARREFAALAARLDDVRARARQKGLFVFDSEPARVALGGVPEAVSYTHLKGMRGIRRMSGAMPLPLPRAKNTNDLYCVCGTSGMKLVCCVKPGREARLLDCWMKMCRRDRASATDWLSPLPPKNVCMLAAVMVCLLYTSRCV